MDRRVGRTREKLAEMLTEALKEQVRPEMLWKQDVYNRTWCDCAAWGVDGDGFTIYSWSTMKDCVKFGISWGKDKDWVVGNRIWNVESKN